MAINIPSGWISSRLEEVTISQKGKRPRKLSAENFPNSIPYLDIKAIETGEVTNFADVETSVLVSEKQLVVVWDGSRSGWVGKGRYGALGSTLLSLTPVLIDINYLYYFLKSKFKLINFNQKGSGIPHVNQDIFWNLSIPIPPANEQVRIVQKIEDAFTKLSVAQIALNKIPGIVSASKQKILKRAFSGELTAEWRKNNEASDTSINVLKNYSRSEIGWYKLKAENCCEKVSNGSTPKGRRFEINTGIPFLKVYNLVNQKIDFNYKPQFINAETHLKQKKSISYPGDVLINIVGPPLGKVAIVPDDYPEWNMNQALVLFRPKSYLTSKYLYYFFVEGSEIKKIESEYRGSAGQSNISLTQCRNFEILIPPVHEQIQIVEQIAVQFEDLDRILKKSQLIVSSIEESFDKILEEAFTGELVNQEVDDISVLSEKEIKKEKDRILKNLSINRKHKAQVKAKNKSMASKSSKSLIEILRNRFKDKEFTFTDIERSSVLEYDLLRDEVYRLLENELNMEFNVEANLMHFKIITP